jgi:hypothetical protein
MRKNVRTEGRASESNQGISISTFCIWEFSKKAPAGSFVKRSAAGAYRKYIHDFKDRPFI